VRDEKVACKLEPSRAEVQYAAKKPEVINLSLSKRFIAIQEEIGLLEFLCQLVLGHLERAPPKNAPMPQELYASVAKRIVAANPVV